MPDLDAILDDLFMQALQGLMDLARTTDKPHIKLRALLEIARLCNPSKPRSPKPLLTAAKAGRRGDSPRRRGGSSDSSPAAPRSGRGGERAIGLASSPTPPIPKSSDIFLRPSGASSQINAPSGGEAPPARRPRPLRGEAADRAIDRGSERSMPPCAVSSPTHTASQTPPASPPTPSSPSRSSCSTPEIDAIERTERIRMATQAREAIALNESKNLPVPSQWRAWARVDEGLHPPDTS